MSYTIDQLNRDVQDQEKIEKDIRIDRGRRYGKPDDTLKNVARGSWMGAVLHANECMERLWTMYDNRLQGEEPDLADMENACHDLRNFVAYIPILFKRTKQAKTICACAVNKGIHMPDYRDNASSLGRFTIEDIESAGGNVDEYGIAHFKKGTEQ